MYFKIRVKKKVSRVYDHCLLSQSKSSFTYFYMSNNVDFYHVSTVNFPTLFPNDYLSFMAIAHIYYIAAHWTSSNVKLSFTISLISFRRTMINRSKLLSLLLQRYNFLGYSNQNNYDVTQNVPYITLSFQKDICNVRKPEDNHLVLVPNLKIPRHRIE
ncbi:LOW QUALITY PROTEIN: hypothetical protein V1477_014211 [Vespula maculifrons]|uniref:Uncharacterized protein n=1 Tax=Vespula maculifrons TaxID=7453 RepID=A0ABD2BKE0_VESMC